MPETKPQRKMVSKGRYVAVCGKKVSLFALGSFTSGAGCILLLAFICDTVFDLWGDRPPGGGHASDMLMSVGLIAFLFLCGIFLMVESIKVETVEPITEHNALRLPLEETLVRSSDMPLTEQPSELLRAVQKVQETPKAELLRTVTGEE